MQLGFNSVLFSGHDLENAFKVAAWCGYDGIEINAIGGMPPHLVLDEWQAEAGRIRALSKRFGVPVTAMEQPSRDARVIEQALQAAVEVGIPVVNTGPGGETDKPETLQETIDELASLAELAGKYGVTLCVKAHVGRAIYNTPTSLEALKQIDHPNFGLDMDPSHIHRADENPVDAIAAVVDRIRHVHVRDCKGRQQGPGAPENQANGRGDIDLLGYFRVLHEHGYDGPVNLEVIGAGNYDLQRCTIIAAETRGHMQACLQACGAR